MRICNFFDEERRITQIDRIAYLIGRLIPLAIQLLDDFISALFGRLGKIDAVSVFRQRFCRNAPPSEGHPRNRYCPHAGNIPLKQPCVHQRCGSLSIFPIKEKGVIHSYADQPPGMFILQLFIRFHIRRKADFRLFSVWRVGFQIMPIVNKSVNPFGNLIPFQQHIGTVAFPELYPLCVVAFRTPMFTRYARHFSAYPVLVFQKFQFFIGAVRF